MEKRYENNVLFSFETNTVCLFSMLLVEGSWKDSKGWSVWLAGFGEMLLKAFHTRNSPAFPDS